MAEGSIAERVSKLEGRVEGLERSMGETRAEVVGLREDVRRSEQAAAKGFDEVKNQLRDVVIGSLNSMPQWGAKQLLVYGVIIGALSGLSGTLLFLVLK